jgi:hypothetical protein
MDENPRNSRTQEQDDHVQEDWKVDGMRGSYEGQQQKHRTDGCSEVGK